eukprot:TRINITY_DN1521_c0_g1_i1.p1 TRINITY_DN1521_c0_g1~~TRINITY_DN1521_c0_g1_i1.p1  ORF type:complete len:143 (+),score=50.74 TRINITY_DN1521_c0_g1_i1:116-544(+)
MDKLEVNNNQDIIQNMLIDNEDKTVRKPNITKVNKNTFSALDRVKKFLPVLQNANTELEQYDSNEINIENVNENEERVIEMNLSLGILEEKEPLSKKNIKVDLHQENDNQNEVLIPVNSMEELKDRKENNNKIFIEEVESRE